MATPVYSQDPITGQAIWTIPGQTTTPTTGPGGTPASGTPWTPPPSGVNLEQGSYVSTPYSGGGNLLSSQPTLESYLRQNEAAYQNNPWAVEHGTAPKSINDLLMSAGQNYLAMNPGTGTPADLTSLVASLGGQYSDWYNSYVQYMQANGLGPFAPAPSGPPPTTPTPGGFIGPNGMIGLGTPTEAVAAAAPAGVPQEPPTTLRQVLESGADTRSAASPFNTPTTGVDLTRTAAVGPTGGTQQTAPSARDVTNLNQLVYSPFAKSGPASTPNITNPTASMLTGGMTSPPQPGITPDQMLAYGAGDLGYLRQIVQQAGMPVDATPAWQAMVAAQQQNINRGQQMLKEQFGASGNRFSTAFGTSLSDFMNQAMLGQNAQLTQAQYQALTDAANRTLQGSTTLGGFAQQGLSQLSSQAFQAAMQATNNNLSAALALMQAGYGAQSQIAGAQNQAGFTAAQQYQQFIQMGLTSAQALSLMQQSQTQLGSQLGGQQQTVEQDQINRLIQQYYQSLPQYNPLMSYFAQGANTYPQMFGVGYPPSQLGAILGGLGSLLGLAPGLVQALAPLFSGGGNTINSQGGLNNNPLALPPILPPVTLPTGGY